MNMRFIGLMLGLVALAAFGDSGTRETSTDDPALRLTAELWRDFMPISPPGGKPLMAALTLESVEGVFPEGLKVSAVTLLNGQQRWSAEKWDVEQTGSNSMRIVVREGPKWDVGTEVEVILELMDAQGATHMVRSLPQTIGRTD
jgi:hypothetical protein